MSSHLCGRIYPTIQCSEGDDSIGVSALSTTEQDMNTGAGKDMVLEEDRSSHCQYKTVARVKYFLEGVES
jgi:hypothetical protein